MRTTLLIFCWLWLTAPSLACPAQVRTVEEVYAELSSLPMPERRKAFGAIDGKMKAKLWVLHFTLFELNRELNEEQAVFIGSLKALMKGVDLDARRDEMLGKLAGQREQAVSLFGQDEARKLLAEIGGER